MVRTPEQLNDYLSESESLIGVYSAELTDHSYVYREPVVVGVTDRRLISLSDADGLTSIPYDRVSWIRSGQTKDFVYRGRDYRLLIAGGLLLAGAGFVGATVFSSSVLTTALFLLAVGGGWTLYYGYQGRAGTLTAGISAIGNRDQIAAGKWQWLLGGGSVLTLLAVTGIAVFTPSLLAAVVTLSFAILTLVGTWMVDYAWRHRNDFDGIEIGRRNRKVVRIGTAPENTVSLLVDPAEDLDQTLSRAVYTAGSRRRSHTPRTGLVRED